MAKIVKETRSYITREIPGLVFLFLALVIFLALISFNPGDRSFFQYSTNHQTLPIHNFIGLAGASLSSLMIYLFGMTSFWLVFCFSILSYRYFRGRAFTHAFLLTSGLFLIFFSSSVAFSLKSGGFFTLGGETIRSGFFGDLLVNGLIHFLNPVGAVLVALTTGLTGILLATDFSLIRAARKGLGVLTNTSQVIQEDMIKRKERGERSKRLKKALKNRKGKPKPKIKEKPRKVSAKPKTAKQEVFGWMTPGGPYELPPVELLDEAGTKGEKSGMSEEALMANSRLVEKKLADFGVEGQVVEVSSGPVITMFEFEPAPGVKISRVANLADDLAMSMRAISIRIVAPLPRKAVIGIEVPNNHRDIVTLREVVSSPAFTESNSLLTLVMGVDTMGQPFVADLRRMPHLLMAGATGAGKSVGLNTMILSILYKARPDEVRFLMIDPKRIELSQFNDLPHLIYPVISEPKMATQALRWAVSEMERRYILLADKGVRNIEVYNRKVKKELSAKKPPPPPEPETEGDEEKEKVLVHEVLPYLVIIIDELADLMMVSSKDVEESITRLAQMARAAGIHLILATQRPSVDVLTGIIKANLPTRVSYQVTSRVDSRTILDANGAENLLGDGDMLFVPPGTARLERVHGAFISEDEIRRVTDYIKAQKSPDYLESLKVAEKEAQEKEGDDDYDEKYDEAVELVTSSGRASISLIQRHLRVGYNRAARMIEAMENEGVVGPSDGAKPREILARKYE